MSELAFYVHFWFMYISLKLTSSMLVGALPWLLSDSGAPRGWPDSVVPELRRGWVRFSDEDLFGGWLPLSDGADPDVTDGSFLPWFPTTDRLSSWCLSGNLTVNGSCAGRLLKDGATLKFSSFVAVSRSLPLAVVLDDWESGFCLLSDCLKIGLTWSVAGLRGIGVTKTLKNYFISSFH